MDADAEVRHYMDKRYTREYSKRRAIPWSTANSYRSRGSQGNLAPIKEPSIPSPDYSPIRELESKVVPELSRAKSMHSLEASTSKIAQLEFSTPRPQKVKFSKSTKSLSTSSDTFPELNNNVTKPMDRGSAQNYAGKPGHTLNPSPNLERGLDRGLDRTLDSLGAGKLITSHGSALDYPGPRQTLDRTLDRTLDYPGPGHGPGQTLDRTLDRTPNREHLKRSRMSLPSKEEQFKIMAAEKLVNAMENMENAKKRGTVETKIHGSHAGRKGSKTALELFGALFIGSRKSIDSEKALLKNAVVSSPTLISSTVKDIALRELPSAVSAGFSDHGAQYALSNR